VPSRAPFAARLVLPAAAVELVVQVAFANGYGYHRDELYFRTAGRHLAFGYDDEPPLTPLIGRLSETLFGETPRGLRVLSALAMAVVVVLVALLARELGAAAAGQLIAAACAAACAFVVAVGHLLSTTTFDLLVWVAVVLLVARLLGGGDERLWLAVGAVVGIGLQNKHLPLLLVACLAVGLAVDRRLTWALRSRWLWIGAALALVIWLPNLAWQATHGWPQLELAGQIAEEEGGENRLTLLPLQLLLLGVTLVPVAAAGLVALLRSPIFRPWRPLAVAYLALLVLLLLTGGKPYYAAPLALCLLAPGAVVLERRHPGRRFVSAVGLAVAIAAVFSAFFVLPVVPADRLADTPIPDVNEDAIETVGWPAFVRTVARVADGLPREPVVFTGNYGEAGAVDRYGPALGLPRAYSGHNAYWRFGRPPGSRGPVIVVGYRNPAADFRDCTPAATFDNGVGLDNEEQGGTVWVCAAPAEPWAELWPRLRHLHA
jgi:hypothetical protein